MKRLVLLALVALAGSQLLAAQDAPPAKIELALQELSAEVGRTITLNDLTAYRWSAETFGDASLGCPETGESYAQVITPGFQFLLTYRGQTYDYRFPRQGDVGVFCGLTEMVEATETPAPSRPGLSPQIVTFTLDPALDLGEMTASVVPYVAESADVPYWEPAPEHLRFEFASESVFPPQILIYPVDDFEAMGIDLVNAEIDALRALLEDRPALETRPPYLPLVNAGRVMWTQSKYLDFSGGSGVRYLTVFQQAPIYVVNADLLYTFQGMTTDGQYYISATFPARTDSLPDEMESIPDNFDPAKNLTESAALLNSLSPADFSPNLALLDDLMLSLRFGPRPAPPEATDEAPVIG